MTVRSTPPTDQTPAIVVGGLEYSPSVNQTTLHTVRELARERPVLYLFAESQLSLVQLMGRGQPGTGAEPASLRRVLGAATQRQRATIVGPNLYVAPFRGISALLPISRPEPLRRFNARRLASVSNAWLSTLGASSCSLIFYWWFYPELLDGVRHDRAVYDCIDEHGAYPGRAAPARRTAELEQMLLSRVDRSFVVAPALLEGRAEPGRDVTVLPNGFDLSLLRSTPATKAVERGTHQRPIVGYAGGLGQRLDWPLIEVLCAKHPGWTFRFAGGDPSTAPQAVRNAKNVEFTGPLPYQQVLEAISGFDVAIVPFVVNAFTRSNSLLKLLDYFAFGLPVVASPLPEPLELASTSEPLLAVADDAASWSAAIAAALREPHDARQRPARVAHVTQRSTAARANALIA